MNNNSFSHRPRDPGIEFAPVQDRTAELVEKLIKHSSKVLVKKLATNDRQWAIWDSNKRKWKSNQAGPLFPAYARTSGFFPQLKADPEKPYNLASEVRVFWPTTGKIYTSRFIWYSNKSESEHHFTTNPRDEFRNLSPASYLLIFQPILSQDPYIALTIDAADDDLIDYITKIFDIDIDFQFNIFEASKLDLQPAMTALQELISKLIEKLEEGPEIFDKFVASINRRSPISIAMAALDQWKLQTGNQSLHPYNLSNPGDVLYELSRIREFNLYKEDEAKTYGAQLVRALLGEGRLISREAIITSLINRFEVFYNICRSAKQARASRAGGSFETHMLSLLTAGGIPHSSQYVFDGSKPDFILPSGDVYLSAEKRSDLCIILTLKTTLRERWRQVISESTGCPIFLATLDESIPSSTLGKLQEKGITLIVPEKFKFSEYTDYERYDSVLSYRNFFDIIMNDYTNPWLENGIECFGISNI